MTTEQIAARLHELVLQGDAETAYQELFSENAVAIEPKFAGFERVEGLDGIREKGQALLAGVASINSREVSPAKVVGDQHIALGISLDAHLKNGDRMAFSEIALYEVQDGKIISEQFFY
ncbi:MAG: nuclear transport factor 2 family protein [Bacteroidota bacterium]